MAQLAKMLDVQIKGSKFDFLAPIENIRIGVYNLSAKEEDTGGFLGLVGQLA